MGFAATTIQRQSGRNPISRTLTACPRCQKIFGMQQAMTEDEWTCTACYTILDTFWLLEDLCWYDNKIYITENGKEFPIGFDPMYSLIPLRDISKLHCICCDSIICKNQHNFYIPPVLSNKIEEYLDKYLINHREIYLHKEDKIDCRTCIHYMWWSCNPLRNWIRFFQTENEGPTQLEFCDEFICDDDYVVENRIPFETLKETIIQEGIIFA